MHRTFIALALAAGLVAGCSDHPFKQSMKLGGKEVSADALNHGRDGYQQYCRPCHGDNGDGKGFSSIGLRPPPRDFTQGLFKFGHTPAPSLPPDAELVTIVRGGLHGTAMLSWDIPDGELNDIVQYIKTFSPRWQAEEPGKVIEVSADPFGAAKKVEAVALGEKLYHAKAQCSGCHPAFVSKEKLHTITKEMTGTGQTEFSPEMYVSQLKDSEYCLEWKAGWKKIDERECAKVVKILPPNFLRDKLRTVHRGSELNDLYKTIASGIGGANMPTWKGALKEEELWGLAYYVHSLVEKVGTPEAAQLQTALSDPANASWKAPGSPPPEGGSTPQTPGKVGPAVPGPKSTPPADPAKKG